MNLGGPPTLTLEAMVLHNSTLAPVIEVNIVNVSDSPQQFNNFGCGLWVANLRFYNPENEERVKFVPPPQHPRGSPKCAHLQFPSDESHSMFPLCFVCCMPRFFYWHLRMRFSNFRTISYFSPASATQSVSLLSDLDRGRLINTI